LLNNLLHVFGEKSTLKVELKIQIISKFNSVLRKTDELNANATSGWRISKYIWHLSHFWALSKNCEKLLLASSCLSVHPSVCLSAWNNSAPTGRI